MGIFDDLPAPRAAAEPSRPEKRARIDDKGAPSSSDAAAAVAEAEEAAADAPSAEQQQQQHDPPSPPEAPAPPPAPAEDQIGPALRRIAAHISNRAKFVKAAGLLRELIASGKLAPEHGGALFAALRAAFADPAAADDPQLRRDYRRLLNSITNNVPPGVLTPAQAAHLSVYEVWVMQRGELATDDSFAFNKALARLKADIAALPPVSADEEAAAARLELPSGARRPAAPSGGPAAGASASTAAPTAAAAAAPATEDDPFGIGELIQQQQQEPAPPAAAVGSSDSDNDDPDAPWTEPELGVMRRQALLDCVTAARAMHKLAWARTGVEMLVEAAHAEAAAAAPRFVAPQRAALDEALRWVKAERAARRAGGAGGGKELTTFEKARAEWGSAAVSKYGKVGGGGDGKSANWLG